MTSLLGNKGRLSCFVLNQYKTLPLHKLPSNDLCFHNPRNQDVPFKNDRLVARFFQPNRALLSLGFGTSSVSSLTKSFSSSSMYRFRAARRSASPAPHLFRGVFSVGVCKRVSSFQCFAGGHLVHKACLGSPFPFARTCAEHAL